MESVEAPWRTVTPGQSTSATVLAGLLASAGAELGPNSQLPSLSVIDCAGAGALANSTTPMAAPPASLLTDNPIPHLVCGRVIAAGPQAPLTQSHHGRPPLTQPNSK